MTLTRQQRAIDQLPTPPPDQSRQLHVLVVGAPRSGTTSLGKALKLLGYRTCVGIANSYFGEENHFPYWTEAIDAKYYGRGLPYTVEEYDKFLGKFEAVTGWGAALLAEELIDAFPGAKVILTDREVGRWVESFNSSIVFTSLWWRKWKWIIPFCGGGNKETQFVRFHESAADAWSDGHPFSQDDQQRYYVDHRRRIVDKLANTDRLLLFDSRQGWEPLCKFLGRDVPSTSCPVAAGREDYHRGMALIWRRAVISAARNTGLGLSILALLIIGVRKAYQTAPGIHYSLLNYLSVRR